MLTDVGKSSYGTTVCTISCVIGSFVDLPDVSFLKRMCCAALPLIARYLFANNFGLSYGKKLLI